MYTRFSRLQTRRVVAIATMAALLCGGALAVWAAGGDSVATEIRITDDGVQIQKNGRDVPAKHKKGVTISVDDKGTTSIDAPDVPDTPDAPNAPHIKVDLGDSNANDIVKFGTDVTVRPGHKVDGSVVAIGGSITIYGEVMEDVVSIGGDVNVRPSGRIHGDAVAVGGTVNEDAGSVVSGENVSVGIGALRLLPMFGVVAGIGSIFAALALFFVLLVIAGIALVLARERMEGMQEIYRHEMLKATVYGFIVSLLLVPVTVLLCITVIGIPVALILFFLLFPVAALAGMVSSGIYLGHKIRPGLSTGWAAVVGLAALIVVVKAGGLIAHLPGIGVVGWVLGMVGALGWVWAFFAGLGAIWLTRFGNAKRITKLRDAYAPPSSGPAGGFASSTASASPASPTPAVWTPPVSSAVPELPPASAIVTPPPADAPPAAPPPSDQS